jgi:hypothetical protein|tara:strand:+ start:94 stop:522 length:429 start_codon:yes stop_codon:yes gene_type:complete
MADYLPTERDCAAEITKSKKRLQEIKLLWTKPKDKGQSKLVEEMAIESIKIHLWKKKYWVLRELQKRGPADLYAYKIIDNRKIDYFVDAKGIHPKANYKPQFKRRAPSKFKDRDAILNRIQGIVYKGKIVFKDLNNKEVKIY